MKSYLDILSSKSSLQVSYYGSYDTYNLIFNFDDKEIMQHKQFVTSKDIIKLALSWDRSNIYLLQFKYMKCFQNL